MNTGLFEGYTTHPGHNYYCSHQNTLTMIMLISQLTASIMTSCINVKPFKCNHVLHLITLQCILVRLSHKEPIICSIICSVQRLQCHFLSVVQKHTQKSYSVGIGLTFHGGCQRNSCFTGVLCDFNPVRICQVCFFPHTTPVKIPMQITYCFSAKSMVL